MLFRKIIRKFVSTNTIKGKGYFWVRFFGRYGLKIEDMRIIAPLFGERMGYSKACFRLGPYRIKLLGKD